MNRSVCVAALALLALSPVVARASAAQAVLQLGDMPPGFVQTVAKVTSNTDAARADKRPKDFYTRRGRVTGYEVSFTHQGLLGLQQVENSVNQYRSPARAQSAMQAYRTSAAHATLHGQRFHPISVGRIGADSFGLTMTVQTRHLSFTSDVIAFQEGAYTVSLIGAGLTGSYSINTLTSLARIVDGRLKHMK